MKKNAEKKIRKPQHQSRPGSEKKMHPRPVFDYPEKQGSDKLKGKIAFITDGTLGGTRGNSTSLLVPCF